MHGVFCQTATECTCLRLREPFGVWQMVLIIRFSGAVHTFTSKRFSMSDGWCQSSDCRRKYMPSLIKAIRCLTDGLNQTIFSTCTYFHLRVMSVWQVSLIVSQPQHVHTSICQILRYLFPKGRFPLILLQQFHHTVSIFFCVALRALRAETEHVDSYVIISWNCISENLETEEYNIVKFK